MRAFRVLFLIGVSGFFQQAGIASAATPLSNPAALTGILYTNPVPAANDYLGYSLALCENYMLVGVRGRSTQKGGYNLYGKKPDNRWELLTTRTYDQLLAKFGDTVAVNENTLVVGGIGYDHGAYIDAGAVSIATKNALGPWVDQPMLYPNDPLTGAGFGSALSLHDSYLAVGASGHTSSKGAAYVFNNSRGSWTQSARIIPGDLSISNKFGAALAINNQYLAVGAAGRKVNGKANSGAVYLYRNLNGVWSYWKMLYGSGAAEAKFGSSMALCGNVLMIGAPYEPVAGVAAGLVYVYDLGQSSTPITRQLSPVPAQPNAEFGSTVALDGNAAVVGSKYFNGDATDSGRATLYQYDEGKRIWSSIRDLPTRTLSVGASFGTAAALYRNTVACSAPFAGQASCGNFYVYDLNQTWVRGGITAEDLYGQRVGLNGTRLAASAPQRAANGLTRSGSVDIFRKHGRDWTLEQTLTEPASSRATYRYFGHGLALGRNALIISAPRGNYDYTDNGKIYIYERKGNSWNVVYSRTGQGDGWKYGSTVALNGNHAAATRYNSANQTTTLDTFTRAANGTWTKDTSSVSPKFGSSNINFGCDMAIDGGLMVVGSSGYLSAAGGIHLYKWESNRWVGKDGVAGPVAGFSFGAGVDVCGNLVAAGCPGDNGGRGAVRLYGVNGNSLVFHVSLAAPDGVVGDYFGQSVAFANQGKALLVSAWGKHLGNLQYAGAVYVYRKGVNHIAWTYDGTIYPPDNGSLSSYGYFGKDIAAFGNSIAVGSDGNSAAGVNAGAIAQIQITPFTAPADFDGDGLTDFGCYHPPSGGWYVYKSREKYWENHFGYAGTLPFVIDCDGDWKVDFGCYHSASGNWYGYGTTRGFWTSSFGKPGTHPITGDFDGDGAMDLGYFDPTIPKFFFMCSTIGYQVAVFGNVGGVPITGDFDGDGIDDYGTYLDRTGTWKIHRSRDGDWANNFGYAGTLPVTGDFDGDGIMDFGCYYPPNGGWYIYKSTEGFWQNNFGYAGTLPVTGDFDGDGIDDFGCYYPPIGAWYIYKSNEGFWKNNFGYDGTIPMN